MIQFIHLTLLLATIQLPSVSVKQIWLPEGSNVQLKCNKHKAGSSGSCESSESHEQMANISNFSQDKTYDCCGWSVELKVARGCIKDASDLDGVDFSTDKSSESSEEKDKKSKEECRTSCTGKSNCQYFTFKAKGGKCRLLSSGENLVIKEDGDTVSGYPNRTCTDGLTFETEAKSWIDALEHCEKNNASLVEISNETMTEAVNELLKAETDNMPNGSWIGLERSIIGRTSDPWMWVSGSVAVDAGFMNESCSNKNCGKIIWVTKETKFKWQGDRCHRKLPFICSKVGDLL